MHDHERAELAGTQRRQRHEAIHGPVVQVDLVVDALVADDFAGLHLRRLAESAGRGEAEQEVAPGASAAARCCDRGLRSAPTRALLDAVDDEATGGGARSAVNCRAGARTARKRLSGMVLDTFERNA